MARRYVQFEFLSAPHRHQAANGTVVMRNGEREMVLDVEWDSSLYTIVGHRRDGYFKGVHKGQPDDVKVFAAWARLRDEWVGRWIEDGVDYLFSFRLRGEDTK